MAPLQIIFNDRAKQTKRDEQPQEATQPHRNPFADGDSSDSDTGEPNVRQISSLSTARQQSPPKKPSPAPLPQPEKPGPKGSQIARLVARRNNAVVGLANQSREARDEALFKHDVDRCDDETSTDGYEKRPVEGFGELMLRNMGWTGTTDKGDEKEPNPRPARLGLGAKLVDMPPGLPKKKQRGKSNAVQGEDTTDAKDLRQEDGRRDAEGGKHNGSEIDRRDGVTAESSEKTHTKSRGGDGLAGFEENKDGSRFRGRRRRKRSRFADDPRR